MTITVNIHNPLPAVVRNFDGGYVAVRLSTQDDIYPSGVTVFFRDLDDAYAWLADAIGKVQVAKIEAANDQPPASTTLLPGYLEDYEPNADLAGDDAPSSTSMLPVVPEWRTRARIESGLAVQP